MTESLSKRDLDDPLGIEEIEQEVQAAMVRRRTKARLSTVTAPLVTFIIALALWEVLVRLFDISRLLLPPPSEIFIKLANSLDVLARNLQVTLLEVVLGFVLSLVVGIPIALIIFYSPLLGRAIYPLLVASQATPKTAIAPLFIVWFGVGILPKVLLTFLISFFPIVISTVSGLQSLEREKVLLARSMGMREGRIFAKVRLPQALPSMFGGLKIAITLAVIGAIVAEFVGSDRGLGYLLLVANARFDVALLFAALITLTTMGIGLFLVIAALERLIIPWHVSQR